MWCVVLSKYKKKTWNHHLLSPLKPDCTVSYGCICSAICIPKKFSTLTCIVVSRLGVNYSSVLHRVNVSADTTKRFVSIQAKPSTTQPVNVIDCERIVFELSAGKAVHSHFVIPGSYYDSFGVWHNSTRRKGLRKENKCLRMHALQQLEHHRRQQVKTPRQKKNAPNI